MARFQYATCCVESDADSIEAMVNRAREIKLATMRRRCDIRDWEIGAGYDTASLPLRRDWHVRYFRSKFRGRPCYYIVHSAIEYVWTPGGEL